MRVIQNQKGMTLTELIFATLLMSFVLIALVSLMMGAITATSLAKSQTKATALANKLIEEARGKSYADIGIQGSTDPSVPSGNLPSGHQTIVDGGQTYEYWYEVAWVDDSADGLGASDTDNNEHDYKSITIYVAWAASASSAVEVTTNIREKDASTTAPTVGFISPPTPDNLTAVAGNSVSVRGTANDTDGTITYLRFYFNSHTPNGATFTESASSVTKDFTWDTTETYTDEYGVDQLWYPDGAREVKVQAWDNAGATSYWEIYLMVDNDPPSFPVENALSGSGSDHDAVTLTWDAAIDGTDKIEYYKVYRSSDGLSWTATSVGPSDLNYNPTTEQYAYTSSGLQSWSNYQFYIEARSPLNVQNPAEGYTVASNIDAANMTLMQLSGNWTKQGNNYTNHLNWTSTPAGTTCTGFDVYRNGNKIASTTAISYSDSSVTKDNMYTYQIKAKNGSDIINTSNEVNLTPGS
jgi:type II secretory pathway pseudopilin PulG